MSTEPTEATEATEASNKLATVAIEFLKDREGFDHWWDGIDKTTRGEIINELGIALMKEL